MHTVSHNLTIPISALELTKPHWRARGLERRRTCPVGKLLLPEHLIRRITSTLRRLHVNSGSRHRRVGVYFCFIRDEMLYSPLLLHLISSQSVTTTLSARGRLYSSSPLRLVCPILPGLGTNFKYFPDINLSVIWLRKYFMI